MGTIVATDAGIGANSGGKEHAGLASGHLHRCPPRQSAIPRSTRNDRVEHGAEGSQCRIESGETWLLNTGFEQHDAFSTVSRLLLERVNGRHSGISAGIT